MILIGLGSSLPFCGRAPQELAARAIDALEGLGEVAAASRLYTSPAWPNAADPPFVNAVVKLETGLSPERLLAGLNAIEAAFGRVRGRRYGPRTLDLDLLDYNGRVRAADERSPLLLPHPAIAERDFVLSPLAEIAPDWRHPVSGESAEALLSRLGARAARPIAAK